MRRYHSSDIDYDTWRLIISGSDSSDAGDVPPPINRCRDRYRWQQRRLGAILCAKHSDSKRGRCFTLLCLSEKQWKSYLNSVAAVLHFDDGVVELEDRRHLVQQIYAEPLVVVCGVLRNKRLLLNSKKMI